MNSELLMKLIELLINNSSSTLVTPTESLYPLLQKVIIRGHDCGVIFGTLLSVKDGVYRVKDSRRLWYWKANSGISLEDVAVSGIAKESKVTSVLPLCDIVDSRISLLIPCSQQAIDSIEKIKAYDPE